ncbi:MAG: hypothetical protein EXQ79_09725 [Acidimicrobiia bacterium]|nr:hypothetical protein [Acidimicrobiia bacterium]
MRTRLVTFAMLVLVSAGVIATAIPAGAGLSDAEDRFCTAVYKAGQGISEDPTDNSQAEQVADYYRDLAKVAPKKSIKKALKTVARYYDEFADIDVENAGDVRDLLGSGTYLRYARASSKVSLYIVKTCIPGA